MTKVGVFNPYSRNRQRRRDEDLSPVDLPEIDRARIGVESLKIILASIPAGEFKSFRAKINRRLRRAEAKFAELQSLKHSPNDFTACLSEDEALAHIDALVGDERATITQMIDAIGLFQPRSSYKDKHVPDKTCPNCGGLLIVKERKRYLRETGGCDITPFVACAMWEQTGCRYKEEFTAETRAAIDNMKFDEIPEF